MLKRILTSGRTRSIKHSMIYADLMQILTFCAVALIFMQILSVAYIDLVQRNAEEMLHLFTTRVETNMERVADLSYGILCDRSVQAAAKTYNANGLDYKKYELQESMFNILYSKTFDFPSIDSITFIFLDDYALVVNPRYPNVKPDPEYINQLKVDANQKNGERIWSVDGQRSETIQVARLYRDIDPPFEPLGYLIISINTADLLDYPTTSSIYYTPQIFCDTGHSVLRGPNTIVQLQNIQPILSGSISQKTLRIGQVSYIYSIRKSSLTGWRFVILLDADVIFAQTTQRRNLYLISLVFVSLIILLAGSKYARKIYQPITMLTDYIRMIPEGVFKRIPVEDKSGIREIGLLAENYNHMSDQIDYLINEVHRDELKLAEMRYWVLQSQINPHFLYNTLETIRMKSLESGNEDIGEMALAMSKLLRASIGNKDIITLREDLQLTDHFLKIQKIRYENRLDYREFIEASLLDFCIPKMSIQTLVENSIHHNLEKYRMTCVIEVSTQRYEGYYSVMIRDNGKQKDLEYVYQVMSGQIESTSTGLGLKSIRERIEIAFGKDYGLYVFTEENHGICIELRLPYLTLEEYEKRNEKSL